jgi:hypothetical protein
MTTKKDSKKVKLTDDDLKNIDKLIEEVDLDSLEIDEKDSKNEKNSII